MRGLARIGVLAVIASALSCSHWYGRGALATTGGAAFGFGLGAIMPCPETEPDCRGSQEVTTIAIGAGVSFASWAIYEIVAATQTPGGGDDDESTGTYQSSGDETTSGGGDSTSDGDDSTSGGDSASDGNKPDPCDSIGDGSATDGDDTYHKVLKATCHGGDVMLGHGTTTDGNGDGSESGSDTGGDQPPPPPPPDSHGCSGSCYWDDCSNQCWCNPNKTPAC
jgi:hypothetical protein